MIVLFQKMRYYIAQINLNYVLQPVSKGAFQLSARGQMERRRPPFLRASSRAKEVKKLNILYYYAIYIETNKI